MRFISGLLRIMLGLGVMSFAGYVYLVHRNDLSGDKPVLVSLLGHEIDAEPQAIMVGIGAAGLIGFLLLVAGIVTLLHQPPAPEPTSPTTDGTPPPHVP
jgi:hypothetical protein